MPKTIRAFLDRIEGEVAVLFLGEKEEDEVHLPKKYLPAGAREGSVLSIGLELDQEATQAARDEAANLIERLQKKSR